MANAVDQELEPPRREARPACGRQGCVCALPIGERFVLWALRQWQQDRALPREGSTLHGGFKMAGLLEALPDFALAMDAFLFGARRAMDIQAPPCATVTQDEATVVALCGLAQADHDGPLAASLDVLMTPAASRAAALRLKAFGAALASAGLQLSPAPGAAGARLH
ncbi:MAG: hypothetical protein K2Y40_05910 [Reyranella sp.]|nr:hypothetical protein [Reyranella sp.]